MEILIPPLAILFAVIAIIVAISRWVFRINDICEYLHKIETLLRNQTTK